MCENVQVHYSYSELCKLVADANAELIIVISSRQLTCSVAFLYLVTLNWWVESIIE